MNKLLKKKDTIFSEVLKQFIIDINDKPPKKAQLNVIKKWIDTVDKKDGSKVKYYTKIRNAIKKKYPNLEYDFKNTELTEKINSIQIDRQENKTNNKLDISEDKIKEIIQRNFKDGDYVNVMMSLMLSIGCRAIEILLADITPEGDVLKVILMKKQKDISYRSPLFLTIQDLLKGLQFVRKEHEPFIIKYKDDNEGLTNSINAKLNRRIKNEGLKITANQCRNIYTQILWNRTNKKETYLVFAKNILKHKSIQTTLSYDKLNLTEMINEIDEDREIKEDIKEIKEDIVEVKEDVKQIKKKIKVLPPTYKVEPPTYKTKEKNKVEPPTFKRITQTKGKSKIINS